MKLFFLCMLALLLVHCKKPDTDGGAPPNGPKPVFDHEISLGDDCPMGNDRDLGGCKLEFGPCNGDPKHQYPTDYPSVHKTVAQQWGGGADLMAFHGFGEVFAPGRWSRISLTEDVRSGHVSEKVTPKRVPMSGDGSDTSYGVMGHDCEEEIFYELSNLGGRYSEYAGEGPGGEKLVAGTGFLRTVRYPMSATSGPLDPSYPYIVWNETGVFRFITQTFDAIPASELMQFECSSRHMGCTVNHHHDLLGETPAKLFVSGEPIFAEGLGDDLVDGGNVVVPAVSAIHGETSAFSPVEAARRRYPGQQSETDTLAMWTGFLTTIDYGDRSADLTSNSGPDISMGIMKEDVLHEWVNYGARRDHEKDDDAFGMAVIRPWCDVGGGVAGIHQHESASDDIVCDTPGENADEADAVRISAIDGGRLGVNVRYPECTIEAGLRSVDGAPAGGDVCAHPTVGFCFSGTGRCLTDDSGTLKWNGDEVCMSCGDKKRGFGVDLGMDKRNVENKHFVEMTEFEELRKYTIDQTKRIDALEATVKALLSAAA